MKNGLKIGIPRALFFHTNARGYLAFFERLGVEVVLSPETNQRIFESGIALSIDESCLSVKIFMGHVKWLVGKCDKIFIPRIESFAFGENACPKFMGMYDIVKNTLDVELISFNINVNYGFKEQAAYIDLGRKLGFSKKESKAAYLAAKVAQEKYFDEQERVISKQLQSEKIKIAVVSHHYNTHDEFVGRAVIRSLRKHGVEVILACDLGSKYKERHKEFGEKTILWRFGKELMGATAWLVPQVDGIIVVSTFPCGPDSMMNEMLRLELKSVPMVQFVFDELQGQTGVETRIESFIDILNFKVLDNRVGEVADEQIG